MATTTTVIYLSPPFPLASWCLTSFGYHFEWMFLSSGFTFHCAQNPLASSCVASCVDFATLNQLVFSYFFIFSFSQLVCSFMPCSSHLQPARV